jgi:hypothetical protein
MVGLRNGKTPNLSEFSAVRLRTSVHGRVPEDPLQTGDRLISASMSLHLIPAVKLIRALLWAATLMGGEKRCDKLSSKKWVACARERQCSLHVIMNLRHVI